MGFAKIPMIVKVDGKGKKHGKFTVECVEVLQYGLSSDITIIGAGRVS